MPCAGLRRQRAPGIGMRAIPNAVSLRRIDRLVLIAIAILVLAFGARVVQASAFFEPRRTDFEVYARAGWAVRSDEDLYTVTDSHGWHYCYPPLFAILMTPLADPPPGAGRATCLPFAVSVGIWYLVSVA